MKYAFKTVCAEKNRLVACPLGIKDHCGKESLASPWARSASLIRWTLTVGFAGVAEFFLKKEIEERVSANDHVASDSEPHTT